MVVDTVSWPQEVPRRILLTPSLRAGSWVGKHPRVFGWERRSERAQDEMNISDVPAGSDPRVMKAEETRAPTSLVAKLVGSSVEETEALALSGSVLQKRLPDLLKDTGIRVQGQRSYPEAPVLLGSTKTHCCVTSPVEGRRPQVSVSSSGPGPHTCSLAGASHMRCSGVHAPQGLGGGSQKPLLNF